MTLQKNIAGRWYSSFFFLWQPTGHWFSCQMGVCHWSLPVAKTDEDQRQPIFFEISFGLWSQGLPPKRSRLHLYVGRPWPCLRSPRWAGETLGGNEKDMQWYAVHLGSWVALSTVQCDPLIWFTIMPGKKDLISPGWPYNRATFSNWDHKLISLKMIWNASDDAL